MQIIPKTISFKFQTLAPSSVVTPTIGSHTHYLTSVPLNPFITVPTISSMQHIPAIVPSLDSSIIDSDDDKLQKRKYQSKEAMFQAIESFEKKDRFGHVQALDCKRTMEKDRRKSGGTSLRPKTPNEPGVKWRMNVPGERTLMPDVLVRPYALTFGHETLFK
ncbi:hypothetical protein ALC56_01639 [Trachymyrmex septentrionalis]|uniref:Uncharacterized protein n=1 Tax=Trachymyrmex septentrionalis TaxID=34720 RepID=A0A195FVL8_9HYME|nr:hypothetical protein ALC56_01639 [Trachymyrmex septentrionalis]